MCQCSHRFRTSKHTVRLRATFWRAFPAKLRRSFSNCPNSHRPTSCGSGGWPWRSRRPAPSVWYWWMIAPDCQPSGNSAAGTHVLFGRRATRKALLLGKHRYGEPPARAYGCCCRASNTKGKRIAALVVGRVCRGCGNDSIWSCVPAGCLQVVNNRFRRLRVSTPYCWWSPRGPLARGDCARWPGRLRIAARSLSAAWYWAHETGRRARPRLLGANGQRCVLPCRRSHPDKPKRGVFARCYELLADRAAWSCAVLTGCWAMWPASTALRWRISTS